MGDLVKCRDFHLIVLRYRVAPFPTTLIPMVAEKAPALVLVIVILCCVAFSQAQVAVSKAAYVPKDVLTVTVGVRSSPPE